MRTFWFQFPNANSFRHYAVSTIWARCSLWLVFLLGRLNLSSLNQFLIDLTEIFLNTFRINPIYSILSWHFSQYSKALWFMKIPKLFGRNVIRSIWCLCKKSQTICPVYFSSIIEKFPVIRRMILTYIWDTKEQSVIKRLPRSFKCSITSILSPIQFWVVRPLLLIPWNVH